MSLRLNLPPVCANSSAARRRLDQGAKTTPDAMPIPTSNRHRLNPYGTLGLRSFIAASLESTSSAPAVSLEISRASACRRRCPAIRGCLALGGLARQPAQVILDIHTGGNSSRAMDTAKTNRSVKRIADARPPASAAARGKQAVPLIGVAVRGQAVPGAFVFQSAKQALLRGIVHPEPAERASLANHCPPP